MQRENNKDAVRPNPHTCGLDISDSSNMGDKKTVCNGTPLAASFFLRNQNNNKPKGY